MSVPLGAGTVSLGLHPTTSPPSRMLPALVGEAKLAEAAGFDGVTLSEHHAGADGYLPNPVLAAGALLASLPRAWVAACPVILPLRRVAGVVEDVAFLRAAYPGRFGVGVAPGWADDDFTLFGVPVDERRRLFEDGLAVVTALREGAADPTAALLGRDPLVAALVADFPAVVSTVGSAVAARRAARAGLGMILSQFMDAADLRRLITAYRDTSGTGSVVLIRRVWLGADLPDALLRMMSAQGAWVSRTSAPLVHGDPDRVLSRLTGILDETGADALNLRVHFPGIGSDDYRSQLSQLGTDVLPTLIATVRGRGPAAA